MKKPEQATVDLLDLEDADGSRCIVRVTGRDEPGILTGHDVLHAEVLASASFVDARLDVYLLPQDLDEWQHDLSHLAPGRDAGIGGERGLSLILHMSQDGALFIAVEDPDRLSVLLGIRPKSGWIEEHQQRLERVRQTWPNEVVETSPGAYEWSPRRRR